MCKPCLGGGFTGNSGNLDSDLCKYCGGIGSVSREKASKIKVCSYCDEVVKEVKRTPIVADMGLKAKMCESCWGMTRDNICGTYGRDIGSWKEVKHATSR